MKLLEKFLHFIWRYRLFNQHKLVDTRGKSLRIVDFGQYNRDAGPDFEFAVIELDEVRWYGHVEMHVEEREWYLHAHEQDDRYNNTVLHVLWHLSDKRVHRKDGTEVPTLLLSNYVDATLLTKYQSLYENMYWIPCAAQLKEINSIVVQNWLDRVVVERIESKSIYFEGYLEATAYDWEKVFMIALTRSFGSRVNAVAFENLANRLDLSLLRKNADNPTVVEAICFGLSGLLPSDDEDDYVALLRQEFAYLRSVHALEPLSPLDWKFLRMRPYNFPTVRLAQLAALMQYTTYWFEFVKKEDDLNTVLSEFQNIKTASYWDNHFRFGKESKRILKSFSKEFLYHIVINAFVPMLFLFDMKTGGERNKEKALRWLAQIPQEQNAILKEYAKLGVVAQHASDSQALLYLKQQYCDTKRCLDCAIAYAILKSS